VLIEGKTSVDQRVIVKDLLETMKNIRCLDQLITSDYTEESKEKK
jgi:hypothetical protein